MEGDDIPSVMGFEETTVGELDEDTAKEFRLAELLSEALFNEFERRGLTVNSQINAAASLVGNLILSHFHPDDWDAVLKQFGKLADPRIDLPAGDRSRMN